MMTKHYNVQFWASKLKEICTYKTHSCFWLFLFLYLLGLKFKKRMEKDGREWMNEWMNEWSSSSSSTIQSVCMQQFNKEKSWNSFIWKFTLFKTPNTQTFFVFFFLDHYHSFLLHPIGHFFSWIFFFQFWILNSLLI